MENGKLSDLWHFFNRALNEAPNKDRDYRSRWSPLRRRYLDVLFGKLPSIGVAPSSDPNVREGFRPNEAQSLFIQAQDCTIRTICSANSVGKTEIEIEEFHAFLTGFRPFMLRMENPDLWPFYKTPFTFTSARILCRDLQHIARMVITPKIRKWLDPWVVTSRKNQLGIDTYFEFRFLDQEAVLDIVSDMVADTIMLEGWSGEIFSIDEPVSEQAYKATFRGLRERFGRCWMAFTLLKEPWMYDRLVEESVYNVEINEQLEVSGDVPPYERKKSWALISDIEVNRINLREGYIEEFAEELTEEERQPRLRGLPAFLSGVVFKEFNYKPKERDAEGDILPEHIDPPSDWLRFRAIDIHSMAKPQAVLYVAIGPLMEKEGFEQAVKEGALSEEKYKELRPIYIYDEEWDYHTTDSLGITLNQYEREKETAERPYWGGSILPSKYMITWIDPFSATVDPNTGISIAAKLAQPPHLIRTRPGSKDRVGGYDAIHRALEAKRIIVSPRCKRLIWEFKRHCYDEKKPEPERRNCDMIENLRRILIVEPKWFDTKRIGESYPYEKWCNKVLEKRYRSHYKRAGGARGEITVYPNKQVPLSDHLNPSVDTL